MAIGSHVAEAGVLWTTYRFGHIVALFADPMSPIEHVPDIQIYSLVCETSLQEEKTNY